MKARDLIAELSKFSPDTEVCALTSSLELSPMLWLGDSQKENSEHEIQIVGMDDRPCLYETLIYEEEAVHRGD